MSGIHSNRRPSDINDPKTVAELKIADFARKMKTQNKLSNADLEEKLM